DVYKRQVRTGAICQVGKIRMVFQAIRMQTYLLRLTGSGIIADLPCRRRLLGKRLVAGKLL
ncbi:MAG: hypothetical protein N3B12_06750, partial [Armatimonadetes bacterium]|nr:hypothetical protein [Armatimonadota bacterium]